MKRSWGSGTPKAAGKSPTVQENKAHGDGFRDQNVDTRSTPWRDSTNEVTIRPNVGPGKPGTKADNFRIDTLEKSKITGKYDLVEAKGTQKAPLTKNQVPGFENFQKYGGVVVSKGKALAPRGTVLPPSKITLVRPLGLFVQTMGGTTAVQAAQERARIDNPAPVLPLSPPGRGKDQTKVTTDFGDVTIYHPKSGAKQ